MENVDNIPKMQFRMMCIMQFRTEIPRHTNWKSYMLSYTEFAFELQNNALWDTL